MRIGMRTGLMKFAAIGVLCAIAAPTGEARAEFPSRNIEFVVGYGAGGGYSDWALALASSMQKYLPGKRKVIVRHMPGGGSVIATEYVHRAQPDGHTIGIYNVFGLAATQMVNKVNYDLSKVTWLGRISLDNEIALVAAKSPIKTIKDLKKGGETYILSTQGLAATGTIAAAIMFERMGVKWKPLNHDKLGPAALAVMRGDAAMYFGTYESTLSYIDAKELRPIVYFDTVPHPNFKDVPIPADIGMPDLGTLNPHRIVGGPPGMPADIARLLESSIRKATEDDDFKKRVAQMKKTITYADAKESAKIVNDMLTNYGKFSGTVKALFAQEKQTKKKK